MNLQVGKVYLIKGGHILRYQGPYARTPRRPSEDVRPGSCLAFREPSEGVSEPAVGASVAREDVIREMTVDSLPELEERIRQMKARNLDASEVELVVRELTTA